MKTALLLIAAGALIQGCAMPSPTPESLAQQNLLVRRMGQSTWTPHSELRIGAYREAASRCEALGRPINVIGTRDIAATSSGGRPESELLFRCE